MPALLGGCEQETELGPAGGGGGQQAGLPPAWRGRPTCLLAQGLLQRGQLHVV